MVYVDELNRWAPTRIRCFRDGSCHLTADTAEELHAFAKRLGLRRDWFQDGRVPHYDLTPGKRGAALVFGAVFVSAKEQARRRQLDRVEVVRRRPTQQGGVSDGAWTSTTPSIPAPSPTSRR